MNTENTAENSAPEENTPETPEIVEELVEPSPIELLEQEVLTLKDKLLRNMAEMDNLRKRQAKDIASAHRYKSEALAKDLLAIPDNLGRAIEALGDNYPDELKPFVDGIHAVNKEFVKTFEKHNIEVVHPLGADLDPNLHQVITQEPSDEYEKGKVSKVLAPGYQLHDRVLRAAMVIVSAGTS